jgi:hypothetical protein
VWEADFAGAESQSHNDCIGNTEIRDESMISNRHVSVTRTGRAWKFLLPGAALHTAIGTVAAIMTIMMISRGSRTVSFEKEPSADRVLTKGSCGPIGELQPAA